MTKHTPGPWHRTHTAEAGAICKIVGAAPAGNIATVHSVPDDWGGHEENARLIAAAPDLLAALRDLYDMTGSSGWQNAGATLGEREKRIACLNLARAAIAKAKGE